MATEKNPYDMIPEQGAEVVPLNMEDNDIPATFEVAEVPASNAFAPIATFKLPLVIAFKAYEPIATLPSAPSTNCNALYPRATLS